MGSCRHVQSRGGQAGAAQAKAGAELRTQLISSKQPIRCEEHQCHPLKDGTGMSTRTSLSEGYTCAGRNTAPCAAPLWGCAECKAGRCSRQAERYGEVGIQAPEKCVDGGRPQVQEAAGFAPVLPAVQEGVLENGVGEKEMADCGVSLGDNGGARQYQV